MNKKLKLLWETFSEIAVALGTIKLVRRSILTCMLAVGSARFALAFNSNIDSWSNLYYDGAEVYGSSHASYPSDYSSSDIAAMNANYGGMIYLAAGVWGIADYDYDGQVYDYTAQSFSFSPVMGGTFFESPCSWYYENETGYAGLYYDIYLTGDYQEDTHTI